MKPLLTPRQAAERLGCSARTLEKQRNSGNGPPFVRLSARTIRYDVDELQAFIDRHRQRPRATA